MLTIRPAESTLKDRTCSLAVWRIVCSASTSPYEVDPSKARQFFQLNADDSSGGVDAKTPYLLAGRIVNCSQRLDQRNQIEIVRHGQRLVTMQY